ncbi:S8 family serine peptidase [Brumicola pallidula]|uniref:Possible protease n=1 Tax=Brumicola pallidula DSM 14239 = ACAM 615 TaxID=1121922 RepID=K6ZJ63_9ALTE|nr:S8 family serine peptidase [Glaciecola pallidula]GAC28923.1 possible protease [Glaciecola pallidula DSM 14239 = ACAM 615]
MTFIKTTILVLITLITVCISQLASARAIEQSIGSITPIDKIDSVVNTLRLPLNKRLSEQAINDSLMPPIESLVTSPLSALPDALAIGDDILNPAWTEVKVEDNWRAVKNQWIVLADESTKSKLTSLGASIESNRSYDGLKLSLLRFTVPENLDSKQALAVYLSGSVIATLDRNHVYQAQSALNIPPAISQPNNDKQSQAQSNLRRLGASFCADDLRIGMIDSAVDQAHPAFNDAKITAKSFLSGNVKSPLLHGTAVASVLLGKIDNLAPLLKGAHLYSAEVFYRRSDYAQGATLNAMIEAINWLIEEHVKVINMSLAGPDNAILKAVVNAANKQGAFIVAAAGNEGPAAAAVFPAGYQDVIAVSAIDQHQQPYRWSNQGTYIDYSAFGVNVLTAQSQRRTGRESGTSMAAPVVSAALACIVARRQNAAENRSDVLSALAEKAIDLGPTGKDPIFGFGAIQP